METLSSKSDFETQTYKELKEGLTGTMLCFVFNYALESKNLTSSEKKRIRKSFFDLWKNQVVKNYQVQLANINKKLHQENVDFMNIISGKQCPSPEDYHSIFTTQLKKVEEFYWKMNDKSDEGDSFISQD